MNAPIRRLGLVVAAMFCALLIATTTIQFFQAKALNDRPGNRRTLLSSYARQRGSILVGGNAVAVSKPSNDEYKWLRTYPQGTTYAAATGYYSFLYGSSAVESRYGSLLSGTSDQLFYRRFTDIVTGQKPQGANVDLTLDAKVQKAAKSALGSKVGAVVALDPKTGAILAMVTSPTYDPNELSGHDLTTVQKNWTSLIKNTSRPLLNRATSELYPPGSTFKLIVSAAALSSGKYTPQTSVPGPASLRLPQTNTTLPNDFSGACGPGGRTTLIHALEISCNTAFASVGLSLGQDAVAAQAQRFGFGQQLNIPMSVAASRFPTGLDPAQLAQSSIGQYDVQSTPLQMAMVSAGIANGGRVMAPYLVKDVRDDNLDVISSTDPKLFSTAVSFQVASELKTMMLAVVDSGTGTRAQIPGVQVAGKTGTAQHGEGLPAHAWFTAFAPADNPKIAVAVLVENGGKYGAEAGGGSVAAPIAKQVIEAGIGR
ncbi:penicillin-binding protein 2 [Allobranchiibius sp. GilTou73]|uniref:peptidoglycan D,D-transpeptidase FtsI family protein n=1 Tax=Allobranchiibius sp. GilTou73 TaxID=2904523 RepID=UPI001F1C95A0|nr:penicillin-binding transpeptidase domain-containing protein [Allobranchiibius sp. GilTou73]UIJ35519.1 penicillin-binding protein 2 [Allobranchiibius sp. GilTou73]